MAPTGATLHPFLATENRPVSKAPKRFRRHGDAPANWQFRDGRPRWIPAPGLRKAGWKARDLKGSDGAWLSEGLSRDAARDINAAVAAWRRGDPVPADFAAIAPAGAVEAADGALPVPTDRLSIGKLMDAWYASREFAGARDARGVVTGGLAPKTQDGYRKSLKRLVDTLAGFAALPDKADAEAVARHARQTAAVRAAHVTVLQPAETAAGMQNPLYTAYWNLHAHAGQHQAYAVLAAASAWLKWCQTHQSSTIRRDWASDVRRATPPGRVAPWTVEQFRIMVQAADDLGLHSVADSIVLGLDLSWSLVDRTQLPWSRLVDGRAFTGAAGRAKTGRVGGTPLTAMGRARVALIKARQQKMDAHPTHVIVSEATGAPYDAEGSHYRRQFDKVRQAAAKKLASCATIRDQDLRDTAFTWMKNAGLDDDGIASRTLQSRKHIGDLGDHHYGEIGPEIADPAARKFEAYLVKQGVCG